MQQGRNFRYLLLVNRCFKNVKSLPCQYTAQKKSWMDCQIFEDWVRNIDRKLRTDGRKIALVIDNYPAHPHVSDLTNIQLIFLPPNTTSVRESLVIRNLKTHYRGRVVRLLCRDLDKGQLSKNLNSSGNEDTLLALITPALIGEIKAGGKEAGGKGLKNFAKNSIFGECFVFSKFQ